MSPYEILGVKGNADDAAIRSAYLALVRKYSPESHPDRFAKINEAYRILKDEKSRMAYYLFNSDPGMDSPFEALFVHISSDGHRDPPGFARMKTYLRQCAGQ